MSVSLSGVLDDAVYNGNAAATGGTVSYASPSLTWTGNLAPGATVTITYSVTVSSPDTGDHILSSTVTSAAAGKQLRGREHRPALRDRRGRGGADDRGQLERADHDTGVGGPVYGVFTNSGQVAYTGITIASNLTDILDDATPNGDQTRPQAR